MNPKNLVVPWRTGSSPGTNWAQTRTSCGRWCGRRAVGGRKTNTPCGGVLKAERRPASLRSVVFAVHVLLEHECWRVVGNLA